MAVVDGTVAGGVAADGTAVVGTGMLATIAGTAVGAGGEAVGIRGGFFRFQSLTLIRITGGTTVQAMGMDRDTVTDTKSSDRSLQAKSVDPPNSLKTHKL